jgi:hypothetical protein
MVTPANSGLGLRRRLVGDIPEPLVICGSFKVESGEQLGEQRTLYACLCDERGDDLLAHAALHGQRGLVGCLVQLGDHIGHPARLREDLELVRLGFEVELGGYRPPQSLALGL